MKSERLKKLEAELADLIKWEELRLVPKQEKERHQEEIKNLKARITEEKERLQFLKEGEVGEFTAPKRTAAKTVYPETPSMSDVDYRENTEAGLETESMDLQTAEEEKATSNDVEPVEEDEEDPFSEKNRWHRAGGSGGIIDPDATEW